MAELHRLFWERMRISLSAIMKLMLPGLVFVAVYPVVLAYSLAVDTLLGDRLFLSMLQFGNESELDNILLQDWMSSLPYAFVITLAVVVTQRVGTSYFAGNYPRYLLIATLIIMGIGLPFFGIGLNSLLLSAVVAISLSTMYYLGIRKTVEEGNGH